jgi:hypothetical protein
MEDNDKPRHRARRRTGAERAVIQIPPLLTRIAQALEKLTPSEPPEGIYVVEETPRCEACKGLGYVGEKFCSCKSGCDLKLQQEKTGHLDV